MKGRTKQAVADFRTEQAKRHEAKTHELASLELAEGRSVRDVHGKRVTRFFENEARWEQGLFRVLSEERAMQQQKAELTEDEKRVLKVMGTPVPENTAKNVEVVRHIPVYEMCWKITHHDGQGNAVVITIPFDWASVREPQKLIELDGQITVEVEGQRVQVGQPGVKALHLVHPVLAPHVRAELDRRAKVEAERVAREREREERAARPDPVDDQAGVHFDPIAPPASEAQDG